MNHSSTTRRDFLSTTSRVVLAGGLLHTAGQGRAGLHADEPESPRESPVPEGLSVVSESSEPWLRKTVKAGMIQVPKTERWGDWVTKLQIAKDAGFTGVEPNTTGGLDAVSFKAAAEKVGIEVDGTVGGYHWQTTHTNPDPQVRARAQAFLVESLRQTHDLGAKTFLIVPGHGNDGTPEEVKQRAFDAISQAIPLADQLGVHILIENVWNHFLYDHDGDSNQSAEPLANFVDSFGTDTVGVQFDLGNHWKYGDVAAWVETLGDRIQKLDIKGFSRHSGKFTDITEGDIDWPSVKTALAKIGFTGWLAAEVGGGDLERLTKVAQQMDAALDCNQTMSEVLASLPAESKSR
ncbi:sugar phosphate isomerase/epimerase family protein [Neorhodopirellula pilleata]|uniref:Endonuclease 4 n=1 Tax=Neorhodopirellula pilleata TaxID=2714738 RepID=A0A5C5ZRZ7_9BACT|nr:sugar phosphate isomerase/epimerase family protein [Neorhodopirellula pilleata]TWT89561.1 endonuclease 4 [Neorhodopirellula pilleata]